jgi:hypothetical protein
VFSDSAFSDRAGYSGTKKIIIESENYKIEHYHDWSINYAYIECINKNTNITEYKISSPALTNLYISHDEKYIIGFSNIKLHNPYQIIILTIEGEYIKRRHISIFESRLNQIELIEFSEKFYKDYFNLKRMNRIYNIGTYYFIDFSDCSEFIIGEEAWHYLFSNSKANHLSNNFSETVTNYIFWFNELNTGLEYIYENNELTGISLLDNKNTRMIININE